MLNPLLIPPKLLLRALDDLNALAEVARRLPDLEARADGVVEGFERRLDAVRSAVELLPAKLDALRDEMEPIRRLSEVSAKLDRLREEMAPIRELADVREGIQGMDRHMEELLEEARPIKEISAVREATDPLAGRMDAVREATDELEPLLREVSEAVQGLHPRLEEIRDAVGPLGDVVDNLPGFMKN